MQSKIYLSCLVTGLLFATSATMRAEGTNAPVVVRVPPSTNVTAGPVFGPRPASPLSVLSKEQLASFQTNRMNARQEMMELSAKLSEAHREVVEATIGSKVDETLIRQKVTAQAEIEAQQALLQASLFAGIQPPLTEEQLAEFKRLQSGQQSPIRVLPSAPPSGPTGPAPSVPPKQ